MSNYVTPELESRLPQALALLRIVTGVFFLLWAVEKFIRPETAAQIWDYFYRISIPLNFSYVVGAVNTIMALALIIGFMRRFTYGYWMIFHTLSVLSTYRQLFKPFSESNHLFLAGVPIVAVVVALYMLRDWDRLSADGRRAAEVGGAAFTP